MSQKYCLYWWFFFYCRYWCILPLCTKAWGHLSGQGMKLVFFHVGNGISIWAVKDTTKPNCTLGNTADICNLGRNLVKRLNGESEKQLGAKVPLVSVKSVLLKSLWYSWKSLSSLTRNVGGWNTRYISVLNNSLESFFPCWLQLTVSLLLLLGSLALSE